VKATRHRNASSTAPREVRRRQLIMAAMDSISKVIFDTTLTYLKKKQNFQ
jgi:hypothetical protein